MSISDGCCSGYVTGLFLCKGNTKKTRYSPSPHKLCIIRRQARDREYCRTRGKIPRSGGPRYREGEARTVRSRRPEPTPAEAGRNRPRSINVCNRQAEVPPNVTQMPENVTQTPEKCKHLTHKAQHSTAKAKKRTPPLKGSLGGGVGAGRPPPGGRRSAAFPSAGRGFPSAAVLLSTGQAGAGGVAGLSAFLRLRRESRRTKRKTEKAMTRKSNVTWRKLP